MRKKIAKLIGNFFVLIMGLILLLDNCNATVNCEKIFVSKMFSQYRNNLTFTSDWRYE